LKLRKNEGGLGFKDLTAFNQAMLGKQAWRISQQPHSLLSKLMKGLYHPHCEFWKAGNGTRPSWGWRSVIVGRNSIAPDVIWSVGNGQKISIREDKWLKSGLIGGPTTRDEPGKVSALIQQGNGMWNETILRMMFDEQRVQEILAIPIGLSTTEDKLVWMRNNSGSYTVKSGYFTTRDKAVKPPLTSATSSHQTNPDLWKHIWHSDTLPKVKQFLWNISQNALPTMDNLHRRKIVPDPLCPICKHEAETIEHTLLLCPWTAQIWTGCPLKIKITRLGLTRIDDWLYMRKIDPKSSSKFNQIASTLWSIWQDRNRFIFDQKPLIPKQTLFRSEALQRNFETWNKIATKKTASESHTNRWQPPKPGVLKLNIDASFVRSEERGTYGTSDAVDRVGIQTSFAAARARRASTDEEEHGGDDPNREANSCDCTGFTHSNADLNRNTEIPFARSERGERGTYGTRSIDRVGAEISFTAACVHRAFTDEAEHGGENPNREVTSCTCRGFTRKNEVWNRNAKTPFVRREREERGENETRSEIDRDEDDTSADDDCGCSETRDERRNREQSRGVADRGGAENKAAVACVCRDSRGRLVGGFSKTVAATSAEQAEASALLETLEFLSDRTEELLEVHTDSLLLVRALQFGEDFSWEVAPLVDRIKAKFHRFMGLTLAHCSREANRPADWVAKAHRQNYLPRDWVTNPPTALFDLLCTNVLDVFSPNFTK